MTTDSATLVAEAAESLLLNIADYPPSAGEDDDELVEVKLGDLKALKRAILTPPPSGGKLVAEARDWLSKPPLMDHGCALVKRLADHIEALSRAPTKEREAIARSRRWNGW